MYKNIYDTFDDKHIPYSFPLCFDEHRKDYMKGKTPTYEFDYGDTLIIPFKIDCRFQEHYINIIVYNFRHEEIYCESSIPDECGKVYLNITEDVSNKIFKKGIYYVQLQAEGMAGLMVTIETLINAEECTIYVR